MTCDFTSSCLMNRQTSSGGGGGGCVLCSSCGANHDSQVLRKRLSHVSFFSVCPARAGSIRRWISLRRHFCLFPRSRNKDIQEVSRFVIFPRSTVTDSTSAVTVAIMLIIMTSVMNAYVPMYTCARVMHRVISRLLSKVKSLMCIVR